MAQTDPNRRFLIAGTSLGLINDTFPSPLPPNGVIFEQFNKHGISWKDYYSNLPTLGVFLPLLRVQRSAVASSRLTSSLRTPRLEKLPSFSLVEPTSTTRRRRIHRTSPYGDAFARKVINAVMSGPKWGSTLLIWTYDEHGGYYDHVPPPAAVPPDDIGPDGFLGGPRYDGFSRYGFRAPCSVVSPWARPAVTLNVSTTRASSSSSRPSGTSRRYQAGRERQQHARHARFLHPAFLKPPRLAKPLVAVDSRALACDTSGPGTIPPPGSVSG